jgi:hypothetical protein
MGDVLSEARKYLNIIKAAVMIAEKMTEAGLEVLEVDREMVILRGDLYPLHISRTLEAFDVRNTEKDGHISCEAPFIEAEIIINASGGMTYLQVLNIDSSS